MMLCIFAIRAASFALWMYMAEDQLRCQAEQALLRDIRTSSSAAVATNEILVYNAVGRAFASGYDTDWGTTMQPRPSRWHFHTSNHASEHPQMAFVMNQGALDEQLPAFQEMWREAFQSVAEDVDRLTRDVGDKVALDPLASIGMEKPAAPKGKLSDTSLGASAAATKRRRKDKQERDEAAATVDPFVRRKTRPKSYWTVGIEPGGSAEDDSSVAAAKTAAAAADAAPHVGEYQCESCSSDNTSFDIIGGAAVGTRKAETFGKKDAPELILRVVCHACGNNWLEER